MTNYINPHPHGGFIQPGAGGYPPARGGYPSAYDPRAGYPAARDPRMGYGGAPPSGAYGRQNPAANHPGYAHQAPHPDPVVIMKSPQGPVFVNTATGEVLGPANPPPAARGHANPYQQDSYGHQPAQRYAHAMPSGQQPEYQGRYGGRHDSEQPTETNVAPPVPEVKATPMNVEKPTPPTPVVELTGVKFKPSLRTKDFSEDEIRVVDGTLYGGCLDSVIHALVAASLEDEPECLVHCQSAIISRAFHRTTAQEFEDDLFQPDIEAVYKVIKRRLPDVDNRGDLVFYQAYNKWLTAEINDYLRVSISKDLHIDSFAADFFDLHVYLVKNNEKLHKEFCDHMNGILGQASLDIKSIRETLSTKTEGSDEEAESVCAILPQREYLAYVDLLSSEIGVVETPEGRENLSGLLSSLEGTVDLKVFLLVSADMAVYKVFYMHDDTIEVERVSSM